MAEFCSSVIEEEKSREERKHKGWLNCIFSNYFIFSKNNRKKSTLKMKMYLNKKNYGL